MSTAQVGLGTATFGSVFTGVFDAETGFTLSHASVPEINTQTDGDANITYCAGTSKDFGQFVASIQVADGVDIDAIVGTTETLTVTFVSGDTYIGSAFLVSAPRNMGSNVKNLCNCAFRWETLPTYTNVA